MQDPEVPTSWVPSRSVVLGSAVGAVVGQFIVAACDRFLHAPLGPELSSATTALCGFLGTYLIPDKQGN
jgi:hypothetical protein